MGGWGGPYPMKGSFPLAMPAPLIKQILNAPMDKGPPNSPDIFNALHAQFISCCYVFSEIRPDSEVLVTSITHCVIN